jgi:hypothetical protein
VDLSRQSRCTHRQPAIAKEPCLACLPQGRPEALAVTRRGPLEALRVAAGQDDVGALGAGSAGGLEPDTSRITHEVDQVTAYIKKQVAAPV